FAAFFFWKGQGQVAHADVPQPTMQQIDQPGQRNRGRSRQGSRQQAQNFDERPRKRVLESLTHVRETGDRSKVENWLSNVSVPIAGRVQIHEPRRDTKLHEGASLKISFVQLPHLRGQKQDTTRS